MSKINKKTAPKLAAVSVPANAPAPTPTHLPALDVQQRYDIVQAAGYLKISRSRLYEHIVSGNIRVIRDGARVFIPGQEILRHSSIAA